MQLDRARVNLVKCWNTLKPKLLTGKNTMDNTMGNQQVKITWEWLAGFYDGEGCINLTHQRCKRETAFSPQLDLVNTHIESMELIVDFLAAHDIPVYVQRSENSKSYHRESNRRNKPKMTIRIARMANVKRFLELILPHLVLKRKQALLLLEFVSTRATKRTLTTARDFEIHEELRRLNRKGRVIESSEAITPDSES